VAGEWIKMRTNLWDDPRIARLCDLTDQSEATVIGGLYWLWAMADEHTEGHRPQDGRFWFGPGPLRYWVAASQ